MSQKKVLIIDYDAESLKSLSDFAQSEGCDVVTASDGITGLEKFKAERPDLVIMEAMLPKLHGFELCKKIAYDSAKKVPVIIVTGIYRESVYKSEAIRFYGASAFFEKPWKKEDLQPVFRDLLKGEKQPAAEAAPPEPEAAEPAPAQAKDKALDFSEEWGLLMPGGKDSTAKVEPPEGATDVEAEIDTILQSALADFGLKSGHEEKPELPKEKAKKPKEMPVFTPPALEETVPPAVREHEEKRVEARPGSVPFGGYIEEPEKKKSKVGLIIGIGAGLVVIALLVMFVLKPKKSETGLVETAQQTEATPSGIQTPAENPPGNVPETNAAAQQPASNPNGSQQQTQPQAAESKPAAKPQATPAGSSRGQTAAPQPGRTSDTLAPILPAQTPTLQIQNQPQPAEAAPEKTEPALAESSQPVVRKAQEGDLIPLDQVDTQPVETKRVQPIYPEMARRIGIEGVVTVNALISESGDVTQTTILRGIKGSFGFDRAAETSMRQWKFRPAIKDGARVKVWKPFNIVFRK